ncbi:MAG: hypothetical protein ABJL67_02180 [Sulfitobacter sp.]
MRKTLLSLVFVATSPAAFAQGITREEGLTAWDNIYAVASHPRCTNCHVGPGKEPMWEGLGYGPGRPHGMGVRADDSRIGANSIPCRTCHVTGTQANAAPHAAPQIEIAWHLPPVELSWHGVQSADLCVQFRDPARTGGMGIAELVDHLSSSPFVAWSFAPGGGRSKPQGSTTELAANVELWGQAGSPCP